MRPTEIRSLKTRMLVYLSIVLVLSMLVSTVAAFLYFFNVTRRQHIRDEQAKLRQIVNQLDFKAEDVISFASSIAVDSTIQELLVQTSYKNEFSRVKARQQVADRLVFYNSLRNYISTATILAANGNAYSSRGFQNENYFINKFSEPALAAYMQDADADAVFSVPYYTPDANIPSTVVCYKLTIRNIRNPSQAIGVLYLEIAESYFRQELQQFARGYADALWNDAAGGLLYRKNGQTGDPVLAPIAADGVRKARGGYLISEQAAIRRQSSFVIVFFILFFIVTLTLMIVIMHPVLSRIVRPITDLTDVMATVRAGNLDVRPHTDTNDEIALLYRGFNEMIVDIDRYIREQRESERQKKEMEFDILLSQINPHYLYNVLNTVVYLAAAEKNLRIVEVVNAQIRILQENLKVGEDAIYTTIREELAIIDSYLTIQKYRYPDLFELQTEIEDSLLEHAIPKAILQPLIENALYHGIVPKDEKGFIELKAWEEAGRLIITVRDNGVGMDEKKIECLHAGGDIPSPFTRRKRIGLVNARDRIAFLYGEGYGIHVQSEPEQYTLVRIELPA